MQISNKDLVCIRCIFLNPKLVGSNAQRIQHLFQHSHSSTTTASCCSNLTRGHSSPTLLYNTLLQHFSSTLFQQSSPTLLYNTLLYNTLLQHFSTTLLSNTSLQHSPLQQFSAILFSNTSLQHSSLQYFSPTLFSTILLPNTSLQHPLQHFSATRFSKNLSSRRGTGPECIFLWNMHIKKA